MNDREVRVTNRQFQDAADSVRDKDQWVRVTGTDKKTREIVKFKMRRSTFFQEYDRAQRRATYDLTVYSQNIISVG